jgi:hypothetical protein
VARAADDDAVEEQVVDPGPGKGRGIEARGKQLGARRELLGGGRVPRAGEDPRELVERGVCGERRPELGREREGELGVAGAAAAGLVSERG